MTEHFDVIVVGAGLSGIGAGRQLQTHCPRKSFAILEARDAIGGTWDLFRYPGIRSDSDMFTLGYFWKPWLGSKAIADGGSILEYVRETARENGLDAKIRFGHRVVRASWSSDTARYTLEIERGAEREPLRLTCNFLHVCCGYYRYDHGYEPEFPGRERFQGRVVHPQHWTDDIDYADKQVVVIGSGATAMTLVPAMADKAARVTMLQRSPTYVVSAPAMDAGARLLRKLLPRRLAYALIRFRNVLFTLLSFAAARRWPEVARRALLTPLRTELGPDFVREHFSPQYSVWDQRLCLVPDGDLFEAIRRDRVSVVTDHIETFTEHGIRTRAGREIPADVIVTATGLELLFLGGMELAVDGRTIQSSELMNYKGAMFDGVPNLTYVFGYTNASWTLKADLTSTFLCRLLNHMDATGARACTPRREAGVTEEPWLDFTSGYVQRALERFPKQGSKRPWRVYQNYFLDWLVLRYAKLEDGRLDFERGARLPVATPEQAAGE